MWKVVDKKVNLAVKVVKYLEKDGIVKDKMYEFLIYEKKFGQKKILYGKIRDREKLGTGKNWGQEKFLVGKKLGRKKFWRLQNDYPPPAC